MRQLLSALRRYARREGARFCGVAILLFIGAVIFLSASAAETLPQAPKQYFNDYAGTVPRGKAAELNRILEDFEKQTSSQILVAIYPRMQSDSSIEDYTVRIAQSWGAGKKQKDNGAVLFVFMKDRAMYLQVGYGLEGAIPDALAKQIIDTEIIPRFKAGEVEGGLTAGVKAILAAARGEYQGTGQTVNSAARQRQARWMSILVPIVFLLLFLFIARIGRYGRRRGGWVGSRGGWGPWPGTGGWGGGTWGGSGGSRGGGGGGWSGGGGFSGGGGSFGGGGAGGRW